MMFLPKFSPQYLIVLIAALPTIGCGGNGDVKVPNDYEFDSRFLEDADSVHYTGQTFRHVLISDLKDHMGGMTDRLDAEVDPWKPESDDAVIAELNGFYIFPGEAINNAHGIATGDLPALQTTYGDISTATTLQTKIAGRDEKGQHKIWATEFVGWPEVSPDTLITDDWFPAVGDLAFRRANNDVDLVPGTELPIQKVFVTQTGLDYQQLVQKFLLGAVTFSQGADDYLDDDIEGSGLLSDNTEVAEEGKSYTDLEHAWDEGWGYFGMSPFYDTSFTAEEVADTKTGKHFKDVDEDGKIDLKREYHFGHSQNAAKRDVGSASSATTDFAGEAFLAFVTGRAIISEADGALSEDELADLREQRDIAVQAWEKAIAASAVHYINECLQDIALFNSTVEDEAKSDLFHNYAKHWSELKGFALSFQFNRHSPMTDEQFAMLHEKIGITPVLYTAEPSNIAAYKAALLEARDILKAAYGFDDANMGDENGQNGW